MLVEADARVVRPHEVGRVGVEEGARPPHRLGAGGRRDEQSGRRGHVALAGDPDPPPPVGRVGVEVNPRIEDARGGDGAPEPPQRERAGGRGSQSILHEDLRVERRHYLGRSDRAVRVRRDGAVAIAQAGEVPGERRRERQVERGPRGRFGAAGSRRHPAGRHRHLGQEPVRSARRCRTSSPGGPRSRSRSIARSMSTPRADRRHLATSNDARLGFLRLSTQDSGQGQCERQRLAQSPRRPPHVSPPRPWDRALPERQ